MAERIVASVLLSVAVTVLAPRAEGVPDAGTITDMTLTYTYDDIGRITKVNDGQNDRVSDT